MHSSWRLLAAILSLSVTGLAFADDNAFVQTNLVANNDEYGAQIVDPNMLDAWGIALRPPGAGGHIWIDDTRSGTSVEYTGDVVENGVYVPLHQDGLQVVSLDTATFTDKGYASVTGLVYNASSDFANQPVEFPVSGPADNDSTNPPTPISGGTSGSAKFVFVTKDGAINAWRSNTATAMTSAPVVINYTKTGAFPSYDLANPVYTGVAMSQNVVTAAQVGTSAGNHLFAADFRNNRIDEFDDQWNNVTSPTAFQAPSDATDAGLGVEIHTFNVMDLGGHVFVTYAAFDPGSDEGFEDIPGFGHVVEYNENGTLLKDFNSGPLSVDDGGALSSPWGMAIAPVGFGNFGGDLLVANFGDGTVSAFDLNSGNFVGKLNNPDGTPLSIDGLWGLTFGNGVSLGDANALYFTAGPDSENDGLLGRINVVPEPASLGLLGAGTVLLMGRRRKR